MNIRLIKLNYNAEATDASGGENSSTMTAPAQSEVAGSAEGNTSATSDTPVYDGAYFEEINRKIVEEDYDPSEEELERFDSYKKSGQKGESSAQPESKEVKTEDQKPVEAPKPEIDVKKLVEEGKFNQWTAEESAAVEASMKRVGAKSPRELLTKVESALSLAGEKGSEVGELRKQLSEKEALLQSHIQLDQDLRVGKPEALQYLQDEYGYTLAQAKQIQANAQGKEQPASQPEEIPEDVIDVKSWKAIQELKKEHKAEIDRLLGTVTELTTAQQRKQQEEQQRFELQKRAETVQKVREEYTDQLLAIAEADPGQYAVKSASLRDLMRDYYRTGVPDPRITPHLELLKFAVSRGLENIRDAHIIKDYPRLSEQIIAAREEGRNSVLNTGTSQSLSSVRNKTNGVDMNSQQYAEADIAAMERGEIAIPKEWMTGQILDRNKVPAHLRNRVFGSL